jgi:diguanylate cyclase (GGDEF)-like protein
MEGALGDQRAFEAGPLRDDRRLPPHERLGRLLGVAPARLAELEPELLGRILHRLEELQEAAATDELTGALRRRSGLAALEREVQRARRFDDRKLVVAFLDVDALKAVNDREGHAAGDAMLRELAAALRRRLRAYDLVIRWGGDEFVCTLSQAGVEAARHVFDDVLADYVQRTGCTFSVGFAELDAEVNAIELVTHADADLYQRRTRSLGFEADNGDGRGGRER